MNDHNKTEQSKRLYGVKLVVNGKHGWAKLPPSANGAKGFLSYAEADAYADQLSRSLDLPAYVSERTP